MSQGEVSASCSAVSRTTSYPFEVHHKSDERPISLLELEWYRVFLAVRLQNLLGHQSVREPDSDPQLCSESHSHEQHKGAETSKYPTWSRGDATRKHPRRRKTVPERAKNRGEIQRSPLISQLCSSLVPCCLVKSFPSWSKFGGSLFHAVPPPCVSTFHNYGHIHRNQATKHTSSLQSLPFTSGTSSLPLKVCRSGVVDKIMRTSAPSRTTVKSPMIARCFSLCFVLMFTSSLSLSLFLPPSDSHSVPSLPIRRYPAARLASKLSAACEWKSALMVVNS